MEMQHITGTAYGLVMRQGIEAGRAGNTGRHGMIAQPAGTGAARKRAGTEAPAKSTGRSVKADRGGVSVGFNYVVHTNHAVPTSTRKRAMQTPFLVLVK